jgi:GNAT superfamily N-acetyltransferase
LNNADIHRLSNCDDNEVGFVALTDSREHEVIGGQSCCFVNPSSNRAETAFVVDPDWQGSGLGAAMD